MRVLSEMPGAQLNGKPLRPRYMASLLLALSQRSQQMRSNLSSAATAALTRVP